MADTTTTCEHGILLGQGIACEACEDADAQERELIALEADGFEREAAYEVPATFNPFSADDLPPAQAPCPCCGAAPRLVGAQLLACPHCSLAWTPDLTPGATGSVVCTLHTAKEA